MRMLDIILILVLLGALGFGAYTFWAYYSAEDVTFNPFKSKQSMSFDESTFSQGLQFYPNMRFADKRISYRLESACTTKKWEDIKNAFEILQDKTILEFYESEDNPDIRVLCEEVHEKKAEEEGYFVAGEGGPTEAINMSTFAVISGGKISLYKDEKCESPQVAIHEILHALGFGHNRNEKSIMYPISNCEQEIDAEIIEKINSLYQVESASDLLIESISANITKGYLNFEIWTANYGLRESGNASLIVQAKGSEIDKFSLGYLDIGTKKKLAVTNLKVPSGADKIKFIVATEENMREIDLMNNAAEISAISS